MRAALSRLFVLVVIALPAAAPLGAETYAVAFDPMNNAEVLLRLDDPAAPTEIGSGFPNCCSTLPDLSAIDPTSRLLYFVAADVVQRNLYSFDLDDGSTDSIFIGFFNYYWFGWDSDNDRILTVYNNPTTAEWRLAVLNPTTGGPANIGNPFPSCCSSAVIGAQAVDGDDDRFYFLAKATLGNTTSWRVWEIDTTTGGIVSDNVLPTGNDYHFLEYDLISDTLYLIYKDASDTERLATFDTGTGILGGAIGPGIASCCQIPVGSTSSIDPSGSLITFMATTTTSSDRRLFTMKTASGASTSELLSTAYNYSFLEMSPGIFRDGFESGDTTGWTITIP